MTPSLRHLTLAALTLFAFDARAEAPDADADADAQAPAAQAPVTVRLPGFDPAAARWSEEAALEPFTALAEGPVPSAFLGSTDGMRSYGKVDHAWFADGFDPAAYGSVAVAPFANSLGRAAVPGTRLAQQQLVKRLNTVGPWKKKVTEGTSADLVVYPNLRTRYVAGWKLITVVDLLFVDGSDQVVAKMQYKADYDQTVTATVSAVMGGVSGLLSSLPDAKDQRGYYDTVAMQTGNKPKTALDELLKAAKKGQAFGGGAPVALHVPRADLAPTGEAFGPEVQGQVAELLATAANGDLKPKDREDAITELANIGASSAVAPLLAIAADKKAHPKRVRDWAVWAIGELGHASAADQVAGLKGVDGKRKKYAAESLKTL